MRYIYHATTTEQQPQSGANDDVSPRKRSADDADNKAAPGEEGAKKKHQAVLSFSTASGSSKEHDADADDFQTVQVCGRLRGDWRACTRFEYICFCFLRLPLIAFIYYF